MEPDALIEALSDPAAYEPRPDRVEVRQTHISIVFLAGDHVYKVKRPVRLTFLDYGTSELRRHFCEEEVRLNRRLAPGVYRGVVPIAREGSGLKMGGAGEAVDWAVEMERLPEEATLQSMIERGEVAPGLITELGRRIAAFHAAAERSDRVHALSRPENLARTVRQNLDEAAAEVGQTVSASVFERLRALTLASLEALRPCLESRWERGLPCDGHGDLRPGHVYFLPARRPPGDITIVDAIEFNEGFRATDPVADMGFLFMELTARGRDDLARGFRDAYVSASGDHEASRLLPLFVAYRAAVRAKVGGLKARAPGVPEEERTAARRRARGYWLVALGALEGPAARPCLVLVSGLPGTGKSTLSRALAGRAGFAVVRSDEVRKELFRERPGEGCRAGFEEGIYSPEWTDQVYRACLDRAEAALFEGRRVVVDATFRAEAWRRAFLDLASRYAVPSVVFHCRADAEIVRARLAARSGDPSDAGLEVYCRAASDWQPFSEASLRKVVTIDTGGDSSESVPEALGRLRQAGLAP
ncbi:MAG: AAA family ATPase [Isosphaeraceae bacterium]